MVSEKRKIGDVGEAVAVRFLRGRGFTVVERNYLKKWGEIDIIAEKGSVLHFVEVKTLQLRIEVEKSKTGVSQETQSGVSRENSYNPTENVHPKKLERMHRAIQSYLEENNVSREKEWQIDLVTVLLDLENKKAKAELLENVV